MLAEHRDQIWSYLGWSWIKIEPCCKHKYFQTRHCRSCIYTCIYNIGWKNVFSVHFSALIFLLIDVLSVLSPVNPHTALFVTYTQHCEILIGLICEYNTADFNYRNAALLFSCISGTPPCSTRRIYSHSLPPAQPSWCSDLSRSTSAGSRPGHS